MEAKNKQNGSKTRTNVNVNVNDNVNDNVNVNVIRAYENEIGLMTPTTLTILDSYLKDLPEELVIKAIEIASEQNKKNLAYIKGILNSWISKGFKTLLDVENERKDKPKDDIEKRVMEALYG